MDTFFNPESIVVFGVSVSPGNLGRVIIENLQNFDFKGEFYPIGPSDGHIRGKKVLTSLDEIENTPQLAVILVPATLVPPILDECGRKGISHIIIESGGFSEFSEDRQVLEEKIKDIAQIYDLKIIGPNCFGAINLEKGVVLPFFILSPDYMSTGAVSIISQSGGVFYDMCMASSCENIGLSKAISIGNKLLINENECLEYLIKDKDTEVIGLYLEHFSDGKRFMETVASTKKPIVLLKANRTSLSREIAKFHTSALAGDDEVAFAAMSQLGVIVVDSFHDFIDCIKAFTLKSMKGKRLGIISRSGGHSVLAANAAEKYRFSLARYSQNFFSAVKEKKLNVIRATNPLDVGDVYDLNIYTEILEMALLEEDVDGIAFIITYSSESDGIKVKKFVENAGRLSLTYNKPVALSVITNKEEWLSLRNPGTLPIFFDCGRAIWTLEKSLRHYMNKDRRKKFKILIDKQMKHKIEFQHSVTEVVPMPQVFKMLERYNLPLGVYGFSKDIEGLLTLSDSIGYPVVLKDASSGIIHKTEAGKVILNIQDKNGLETAAKKLNASEYLIQKLYPSGIEIMVGVKFDKTFGHTIVIGLGGIFTEIIRDISMRILPVDEDMAGEMIDELKASAILKGYRGSRMADIDALKQIIVGLSDMTIKNPDIYLLDLNPVIVYEKGSGAIIVDARMSRIITDSADGSDLKQNR